MLAIMDKYAYNLEGLVQERTNQLTIEKKKTEALLHRMLPKYENDYLSITKKKSITHVYYYCFNYKFCILQNFYSPKSLLQLIEQFVCSIKVAFILFVSLIISSL